MDVSSQFTCQVWKLKPQPSFSLIHPMAAVSSSICNRIYNLSFTHPSLSLTTCNFRQRPISQKPFTLNLKSQSFTLSFFPLHRLPPPSAAFDGFEVAQDTTEFQQDEPETEPVEKTEQEEEQKVSDSNDAGRLYVGNLPYSITNSELGELFGEAGTVASVEVSSFSRFCNPFSLFDWWI